ncbi:MAG: lysophospholipid acyltransferase family protein [Candidatus Geothermincolia bacterium]
MANLGPHLKYFAFRAMGGLVGMLPVGASYALANGAGRLSYCIAGERKRTVRGNMERIRPGASDSELRQLTLKSFQNYALYWTDFLRCFHLTADEINASIVPHGTEWFDRCLAMGKGAVLALPHYGSWDLIGGWVGQRYDFWAVAEVLEPRALYDFHTELRRRMGIKIIPLADNTVEKVIEALMAGGMVALLADRVVAGGSTEVEFFGAPVKMPIGPALLAVKLGVPLIPCLTIRRGDKFHGYVGPPLDVPVTEDTRADVREATQRLARVFEGFIREDPTQWHMFQPIFRD